MRILFSILIVFCANTVFAETNNPFSGSRFYTPNNTDKRTSIVFLHGSEGGSEQFINQEAKELANNGFAVLALCYFDCNRTEKFPRKSLKDIDPNIVLSAVSWLRTQDASNKKVFVYGYSRGAELAMIVGSLPMTDTNRPTGIIAHAPNDVFVTSYNWGWKQEFCWLCVVEKNKCLELPVDIKTQWKKPNPNYQWNAVCGTDNDPAKINFSSSAWVIDGKSIPTSTRIEIEKYDRPILITHGLKDPVWPADYTKRIEATLKAHNRQPEVHYFPNGVHMFTGEDELARRNLVLNFLKSK
jgi:dienelactone hydrolase